LPLDAYADLAVQHWFVYETLEDAGQEMAKDPVAGRFVLPELDRAPANRPRSWPRCPRRTG
jgi:heme oxygenase